MQFIRLAHSKNLLLWLVVVTVCLRSLIAPGFMVESGGGGMFDIRITLCGGLNAIDAIKGMDSTDADHHAHHRMQHEGKDENAGQDMSSASCGVWSASVASLATTHAVLANLTLIAAAERFDLDYNSPLIRSLYYKHQQPRAPPVISTV
jgi:hypothetical protein